MKGTISSFHSALIDLFPVRLFIGHSKLFFLALADNIYMAPFDRE
jgi:hypothetical protein